MNIVRGILYTSIRGYRGSPRSSTPNVRPERKIEMVQPQMPVEGLHEFEEDDDDEDFDAHEPNLKSVAEYNILENKEMKYQHAKLKMQIVRKKFFKESNPVMLTWAEREQICSLHAEDSELWTAERLSENFPASSVTIQNILKSHRPPQSVEVIEKYEEKVRTNWKLFKAGKLAVDPRLQVHLEKFKYRKIMPLNRESMEKYLKPKPVLPKPKSTYFTSIITNYLDKEEAIESVEENRRETGSVPQIESGIPILKCITKPTNKNRALTLDDFLKEHVDGITGKKLTLVDRVIIDDVKQKRADDYKSETLDGDNELAANAVQPIEKRDEILTEEAEKSRTSVQTSKNTTDLSHLSNNIETGIISRKPKKELLSKFPEVINIPKNQYKPGKTYRIQDCYYDDDGEFLYRVPVVVS